jgi:outer membrane protein TolC
MLKFQLATVLLLFVTAQILSQSGEKLDLDLNKCIEIALENNHTYKQAKLTKEKADEQVDEAYGTSLFPSIDGSINYRRALERGEFIIETPMFSGRFPIGTANTLTGLVEVEQPLFTGAMFLAVSIAQTFAEITDKSREYSRLELITRVKEAYLTHLLSKQLVDLANVQIQRAKENLNNTKSLYDAGLAAEYDYIRANVQYQNLIPALTETENQIKLSRNNLRFLMGLPYDQEITVSDSLFFEEVDILSFDEGINRLLAQNQLLKQAELDMEMKDLIKSYEFTEHLPKINAFGSWQIQAQEEDTRPFSDWRYIDAITVGVGLSVPIFRGFTIDSKVEQAEIDYKIASEVLLETKKALLNDYENSVLEIGKIREQIDAYKAAVDETERGYEIASKRYNSGLGTQLEVTDALVESTRAKLNYLQAVHDYYILHARLDLLLGENGIVIN